MLPVCGFLMEVVIIKVLAGVSTTSRVKPFPLLSETSGGFLVCLSGIDPDFLFKHFSLGFLQVYMLI